MGMKGSTPAASTTLSSYFFNDLQVGLQNRMHFACALGLDLTEFSIGLSLYALRCASEGRTEKGVARP
jgi:hypothetical protein